MELPFDPSGPALLGGRCGACDRWHFPPRDECPWCGGSCSVSALARQGVVWSACGYPLGEAQIALVELDPDVLVQGPCRDPVAIGDKVVVVAGDPGWGFARA